MTSTSRLQFVLYCRGTKKGHECKINRILKIAHDLPDGFAISIYKSTVMESVIFTAHPLKEIENYNWIGNKVGISLFVGESWYKKSQ